ncbi:MAG TPA: helix-turn-helix domain-containing protein [Hymenobacter sp.]|uniref:helix-turn-helix domain-containing protein n=1 Tax=Hymenobacter sp. TaxID=1898978 RepID=UPI002D7F46FE|nr:helix-turn-helix domain-containing protein [Hymenobacter sp.]HET9503154.1 helix-turn-helix domain-containing protein [Hymenobacter sp.]
MATQHRGEIIKAAIRKAGVNQAKLAQTLGVSRSSLYRQYEVPNLSLAFIRQVGEAIAYDFSTEIRGLLPAVSVAAEPSAPYAPLSLEDCRGKLLQVHEQLAEKVRQYDELLARYHALLAERGQ